MMGRRALNDCGSFRILLTIAVNSSPFNCMAAIVTMRASLPSWMMASLELLLLRICVLDTSSADTLSAMALRISAPSSAGVSSPQMRLIWRMMSSSSSCHWLQRMVVIRIIRHINLIDAVVGHDKAVDVNVRSIIAIDPVAQQ